MEKPLKTLEHMNVATYCAEACLKTATYSYMPKELAQARLDAFNALAQYRQALKKEMEA